MKKKGILALATLCVAAFALAGCGGENFTKDATALDYSTGFNEKGSYDDSMFYRNDLLTSWAADPGSIYCEEDGYWYIFVTEFSCYRTKDFVDYEDMGKALVPDSNSWSYKNYWAPEVVYDKDTELYYMYYSASAKDVFCESDWDSFRIGIAVSETPQGPYHEWEGERTLPKRDKEGNRIKLNGKDIMVTETVTKSQFPIDFMQSPVVHEMGLDNFATIDVSPFFDGDDFYLYFDRHRDRNNGKNSIWGVKMLDMVTPDYDTLTWLTEPGNKTPNGEANFEIENTINEGPFMISHVSETPSGEKVKKYYLTYTNYGYTNRGYSVAMAVGDSPLGEFVKVDKKNGMPIHGIDMDFDHMAGTGHHQFIQYGDEWFILYHAFTNHVDNGSERSLAVDRIHFVYDEELGYDLIYSNGPTYSLQPLPYAVSGYKNLAIEATVTADNVAEGSSVSRLNDELVAIRADQDLDFLSANDSVTVTLTFDREVSINAIMVYNGQDIKYAFSSIDVIRFDSSEDGSYYIENLAFPEDYIAPPGEQSPAWRMRPGGAAIAEFNTIKTNKITLKFSKKLASEKLSDQNPAKGISISDIVVLGK